MTAAKEVCKTFDDIALDLIQLHGDRAAGVSCTAWRPASDAGIPLGSGRITAHFRLFGYVVKQSTVCRKWFCSMRVQELCLAEAVRRQIGLSVLDIHPP